MTTPLNWRRFVGLIAAAATVIALSSGAAPAATPEPASPSTEWQLTGNAGTNPVTHFLGTTDNQRLELRVDNRRALRIEPRGGGTPNLIGGAVVNSVTPGAQGAFIGGGGGVSVFGVVANRVTDSFGTIAGGLQNRVGDNAGTTEDQSFATIGGGRINVASGRNSTVGGGDLNTASDFAATVSGGNQNTASAGASTIAGGEDNAASAIAAFVGGGGHNIASGFGATIGGGLENLASGDVATTPGGFMNSASGRLSFAAGSRAKAIHPGAFVWADNTGRDFVSTVANQFSARATGGVRFVSAISSTGVPTAGVRLAPGASSWSTLSDRSAKENIAPVFGLTILERLARIPITTWNYKSQDDSVRHIGPMAQDFARAFAVGEDQQHISTVDADGVALAAIQGLYSLVQAKETRITKLEQRNASLESRLAALERAVRKLSATKRH